MGAHGFDHCQGSQSRGRLKKSTARAECLGRGRDGFGTKVHAVVDALGNCLRLLLTPAQGADSPQLPALLTALAHPPGAVVCDKAYDKNNVFTTIANQRVVAVIPPKAGRLNQRAYDRNLYADRNKIERFLAASKKREASPPATKKRPSLF